MATFAGGRTCGFVAALGMTAASIAASAAASAADPRFGRVLDRIECERDPAQAYALYVPSAYTPDRKWPAIFCFDAAARGLMPVERLKTAAEKYGCIVAGSLNSRNGPWTDNAAAADAMIHDVTAHFSIDPRRLYTAGMSGGARVATSLALAGVAQGAIACGAGFPVQKTGLPRQVPFAFFGVAGFEDFNYGELQRLDGELAARHAPHRIVTFDGGHTWPPATVLTEAVEWLELQAIRTGQRPKDTALIEALWQTRLAALPTSPPLDRWRELNSLAADFAGLADTAPCIHEAETLAASRTLRDARRAAENLLDREAALLNQLGETSLGDGGPSLQLAADLRRKADAPLDSPERRMIRRVIAGYASMARETVRDLLEQASYDGAESYLDFGVALQPDNRGLWFDLARARALNGSRKRALDAFARAADEGFSDAKRAESDPAFEKLHDDPRFQSTLAKMRAEAANPSLRLPALRVSAALAGAELRLVYLPPNGPGNPPLSHLRVETVRPDSSAARAGLLSGMEITSIQGLAIRGITEREFNDAIARRVKKEIVLTARDPGGNDRELRIPLCPPETGRAGYP